MIEEQGRNKRYATKNQSKKLATLTDKGNDHKYNYKEILNELVKERFDKIIELTNEINQNDLMYYFKGDSFRWFQQWYKNF